jgi:hypothetical protein
MEERLTPTGGSAIAHPSGSFTPDQDGWFDVPREVGLELLSFRQPNGERFYTPDEVNEQVRLGSLQDEDESQKKVPRGRKGAEDS